VAPDGQLAELDFLWPIFHYQRDEEGNTDFRIRPIWRRVRQEDGKRSDYQFLVPFGDAIFDEEETKLALFPLFHYREHLEEGEKDNWDVDWSVLLLMRAGYSKDGEDYFGLFPLFGKFRDFLTYDEYGFVLWPLYSYTKKGEVDGTMLLWPLVGWGGNSGSGNHDDSEKHDQQPHWWRVLPFYGQSVHPGISESYTALWPFLHWGTDYVKGGEGPNERFFFFPLFGFETGGRYHSYSMLWPFFQYAYETARKDIGREEGESFWQLDAPWPLIHWRNDFTSGREVRQRWFYPLYASTSKKGMESQQYLWPLIWNRHFYDETSERHDLYALPLYWDIQIRRKARGAEKEMGREWSEFEYRNRRLYPLLTWQEDHDGRWIFRTIDPWPFDGSYARGIREAWDWAWTLAEVGGDARGNHSVRTFANLYTSRNFAGRRFQCSVPFLFNYEAEAGGRKTLRRFQFLPIRWGGVEGVQHEEAVPSESGN